jgi:hypothetical protein
MSTDRRGYVQSLEESLRDFPAIVAMHEEQTERAEAEFAIVRAERDRLAEALREIARVENTKHICVRHGGTVGADDPETCWCGISLDADEKARALARAALEGKP